MNCTRKVGLVDDLKRKQLLVIIDKYQQEDLRLDLVDDFIDTRYKDSQPTLAFKLGRGITAAGFFRILSLAIVEQIIEGRIGTEDLERVYWLVFHLQWETRNDGKTFIF